MAKMTNSAALKSSGLSKASAPSKPKGRGKAKTPSVTVKDIVGVLKHIERTAEMCSASEKALFLSRLQTALARFESMAASEFVQRVRLATVTVN